MRRITFKPMAALALAGLLLGSALPAGASADEPNEAVLQARADFAQGRDGDSAAVDRAAAEFKRLSSQDPGNPLLLAYYGSAVTLQAKYSLAPWNKMKYAERGLDALDKALAMLQPEHEDRISAGLPIGLGTRLVALSTFLAVPSFFHRFDDAKDVLQQALKSPSYRAAAPDLRAQFALQAAIVAQKQDQRAAEVEQLQQAVALSPNAPAGLQAKARLKELGL